MIDRFTLAAIHVGKKQLGLDDDTYRALLHQVAGVASARELDGAGAGRVLAEMRRRGFDGTSKPRRSLASQPMARKARALWLALWNLDETESAKEKALAAFAKGITGKEDLRFCTATELGKVVEALKAWCRRIGLSLDRSNSPLEARRAVVREQWARLHAAGWARIAGDRGVAGYAHTTWCTPNLRAVDQMEAEHLDKIAARLGPLVRHHKCGRRLAEARLKL